MCSKQVSNGLAFDVVAPFFKFCIEKNYLLRASHVLFKMGIVSGLVLNIQESVDSNFDLQRSQPGW